MKKDKQQSSFVNIGSSSLLIIFLILSLVTFAILSLSGAKSDYSFSQRLADHKTAYYEASNQAERILGQIDEALAAGEALDGQQLEGITIQAEEGTLTFSVPMEGEQELLVKLEVTDSITAETYYTIKTWQIISTKTWESDQSIQLLPMGE